MNNRSAPTTVVDTTPGEEEERSVHLETLLLESTYLESMYHMDIDVDIMSMITVTWCVVSCTTFITIYRVTPSI